MKLTWKFWLWPKQLKDARQRLLAIREITERYYNDSRLTKITELTKFNI